jgi:hypothetical protein
MLSYAMPVVCVVLGRAQIERKLLTVGGARIEDTERLRIGVDLGEKQAIRCVLDHVVLIGQTIHLGFLIHRVGHGGILTGHF